MNIHSARLPVMHDIRDIVQHYSVGQCRVCRSVVCAHVPPPYGV